MPIRNQFVGLGPAALAEINRSALAMRAMGPVIAVELHAPALLLTVAQQPSPPVPVSGLALVDTGASITTVQESALVSLGIQPVNSTTVRTPSGTATQLLYPAEISFPGSSLPRATFAFVAGSPHLTAQGIVALIGRDVLSTMVLIYNGPAGVFTLAL